MRMRGYCVVGVMVIGLACAKKGHRPTPGVITVEGGGAVGFQHGVERSRFVPGDNMREVSEFGFHKIVGSRGTWAVDASNGAAIAIANALPAAARGAAWYTRGPDAHNAQVLAYFVGAGLLKEQVGHVVATTSLAANGSDKDTGRPVPSVGGYQSVLERKIAMIPVPDSIAWARMDDRGEVRGEWVYWPAIPAQVISDARRLQEQLSAVPGRSAFLARLPPGLPEGKVVIRHSSATVTGPFEAFASYDVLMGPSPSQSDTGQPGAPGAMRASVVRHFDVQGQEHRLPQERRNIGQDFPTKRPLRTPVQGR